MAYNLNTSAVEMAREIIVKGRIDMGPWLPFENIDAAQMLGPEPVQPIFDGEEGEANIAENYGRYFLGISGDADKVGSYAYPFARVVIGDEPRVSVAALRLIRIQAGTLGDIDVFRAVNELLALVEVNYKATELKQGDVEAMDPDGWWVEVLRTGTWTGATGGTTTFTTDDLDQIIESFNATFPKVRPVLRLGDHPGLEPGLKPAVGWVTALKREGDKMLAYFSEVPSIVKQAIKDKLFGTVSVGLWRDWSFEGSVHRHLLNHVAILGAELPAVSGLNDLAAYMAKGAGVPEKVVCFTQAVPVEEATMPTIEELQAQLAEEKQKNADLSEENAGLRKDLDTLKSENADFRTKQIQTEVEAVVDDAVNAGRLLPKNRDDALRVGIALRTASVNLSADADDPYDNWKKGIEEAGTLVEFSEKGKTGKASDEPADQYDSDYQAGAEAAKAISARG